jgi:hypothetical protein
MTGTAAGIGGLVLIFSNRTRGPLGADGISDFGHEQAA